MTDLAVLPVSRALALKLIATLSFRPFTDMDWNSWSGCESAEPMIAETDDFVVIIDGDNVTFNAYNDGHGAEWTEFTLRFDGAY